ncbi:MAG: hypothetical protein J07HQW2_00477 [Haloquadratum walsbyi J07HQW2]|uniref:Uncharacterized protein n=1 Tax=Haloquadratum walsbyi J07HQW2 TaxID=1238425 RepID=U1NBM0_9EURY|nr:MAG: hypothetical protein J07HQW2_00477 [Haloquadratum walsbyi J07HQW2]
MFFMWGQSVMVDIWKNAPASTMIDLSTIILGICEKKDRYTPRISIATKNKFL